MEKFQLVITKKAEKALDSLPENYQARIVSAFREIQASPFENKKLSGKKKGQYSVRVWPYRIIYRVEKQELIIIIIDVDNRKDVYK